MRLASAGLRTTTAQARARTIARCGLPTSAEGCCSGSERGDANVRDPEANAKGSEPVPTGFPTEIPGRRRRCSEP